MQLTVHCATLQQRKQTIFNRNENFYVAHQSIMTTLLLQFLLIMLVLQKFTTPYEYVVSFQQSVICASVSNVR